MQVFFERIRTILYILVRAILFVYDDIKRRFLMIGDENVVRVLIRIHAYHISIVQYIIDCGAQRVPESL